MLSLDGNPVPLPHAVDTLTLGVAERIDALVTMNAPGVWIFGETDDAVRNKGLGIVVEYENKTGAGQWTPPSNTPWDYTLFGAAANQAAARGPVREPDETVPMIFKRKFAGHNWVDHWTINGKEFPKTDPVRVRAGKKYRRCNSTIKVTTTILFICTGTPLRSPSTQAKARRES